MAEWALDGLFAPGRGRTQDPFLGTSDGTGAGRAFRLRTPAGRAELTGLPRLVTTRGGAYVFLPSLTGIRHLAGL